MSVPRMIRLAITPAAFEAIAETEARALAQVMNSRITHIALSASEN